MLGRRWIGTRLLTCAVALAACSAPESNLAYPALTQHYSMRVLPDPVPPRAGERTRYKVVVRDRETGQPIEGGEGRIFANQQNGVGTWDSFVPGKELGTYYANLNFLVSGNWAIAIQFRRDSTHALERADWMQEVLPDTSHVP